VLQGLALVDQSGGGGHFDEATENAGEGGTACFVGVFEIVFV
jgi:hypothetical protein